MFHASLLQALRCDQLFTVLRPAGTVGLATPWKLTVATPSAIDYEDIVSVRVCVCVQCVVPRAVSYALRVCPFQYSITVQGREDGGWRPLLDVNATFTLSIFDVNDVTVAARNEGGEEISPFSPLTAFDTRGNDIIQIVGTFIWGGREGRREGLSCGNKSLLETDAVMMMIRFELWLSAW